MSLVSSSLTSFLQMEEKPARSSASTASFVSLGSSRSSLGKIEDDGPRPPRPPSLAKEEPGLMNDEEVYFAVEKEFKLGKANLIWVLKNTPRTKKIVFVHVYVPAQLIPMMGAWFPADQLKAKEVKAYREIERKKVEKALDEYTDRCLNIKEVQAERLVREASDVGQGLVDLIAQYKITNFVMGAAADKNYSKKLKKPKSKKAVTVQQHADPSCKIWFVCKGNLIYTREAGHDAFDTRESSGSSPGQSEILSPKSSPQMLGQKLNFFPCTAQEAFKHKSASANSSSHGGAKIASIPQENLISESPSPGSKDGIIIELWDVASRGSKSSGRSMHLVRDDVSKDGIVIDLCNMVSRSSRSSKHSMHPVDDDVLWLTKDDGNEAMPSTKLSMHDTDRFSSHSQELEDAGLDDDLYKDLEYAVTEAKNLKREAYEETMRRLKTERDLPETSQKVKAAQKLSYIEIKQSKEIEERLSNERMVLEELWKQRDKMFEELQKEYEQIATLRKQIDDSDHIIKDFERKLSDARYLLISLQSENTDLQKERDDAIREAEQLRRKLEEMATSSNRVESFIEFSYSELEEATNKFDSSLKIGEGGYGIVYKGILGQKKVAIKMLNFQSMQGQKEFNKEVNVLSKLRHPNLVNLIGACPEASALVYDFLPNGSLEDRLNCKDSTPPLTWQARVRIAAEICSALNFLHSNNQLTVVHGDLKPANILLDGDLVTKLGDFGICSLLQSTNNSTTFYRATHAMGTFVYLDPEFLASGDLTPRSDVYSFGVIVLQLLTGRSAFGISRAVQEAIDKGSLCDVLDASAGDWPYAKAERLAHLGLRCTEITRKNRPDATDAWKTLEPLMKSVTSKKLPPLPSREVPEINIHILPTRLPNADTESA